MMIANWKQRSSSLPARRLQLARVAGALVVGDALRQRVGAIEIFG